jgi:uncharacterized protein (UPF0210 family)
VEIRTITLFDEFTWPPAPNRLAVLGGIGRTLRAALEGEGYVVQSVRLALGSVAQLAGGDRATVIPAARGLDAACVNEGIDYVSLGVSCPRDPLGCVELVPDILAATTRVFAACLMTDEQSSVWVSTARRAAATIRRNAAVSPDGFANLRFAVLANVPSGVPFFPAAYHGGGPTSVAIGAEPASLAVESCRDAASLDEARARLVAGIESHGARIHAAVERARPAFLRFRGLDFSLAPFPALDRSVGAALERLSGVRVGEPGTLAAVAVLTDALRRAQIDRTGFSGVFLPVFEDAVLAARAVERLFTIDDLLLWSAVCGTGLDTVPLPGDVSESVLAAVLVDLASLAVRLDKPLTARLMPIPGRQAGDPVQFDFPYFAPARVLDLQGQGLSGLLGGADTIARGAPL